MRKSLFALALAAAVAIALPVHAHFVWVVVQSQDAAKPTAEVYFAELAETDDAELLDRIAKIDVRARNGKGDLSEPLKLEKRIDADKGGAWVATVDPGTEGLSATINYGVLERRGDTFLLMYHAKYLNAGSPAAAKIARDERLPLDVVPQLGEGTLKVLWQGKPVSGSEVTVQAPGGEEEKFTTDDKGLVKVALDKPGIYSIRAKWVVEEKGSQDGKDYAKANHYSTLSLRVPGETANGK